METRVLEEFFYVLIISANADRHYSLVEGSPKTDSISDDENNFDLANTTPIDKNGKRKNEFFSGSVEAPGSGPYSLIGEEIPSLKSKRSIKQKRTSKRISDPTETAGSTYTEIPSVSHSVSKQPLTGYIDMGGATPENIDNDSLYQVPPQNHFQSRANVGAPGVMSQAVINNDNTYQAPTVLKQRSQTLPVNIGHRPTAPVDIYDNVNLQNTPSSSADFYDNVQLTNSPATEREDTYDNVNITNKQQNILSATSPTSDMYYQQPPSTSGENSNSDMYYQEPVATGFKPKPVKQQGIKQNTSTQQQYTSVKTKSMKQRRTGTVIKRDISLDDNCDVSPDQVPQTGENKVQKQQNPQQEINTENNGKIDEINFKTDNLNLNKDSMLDATGKKPSNEVDDDSEDGPTPTPKPRTKVKQNRTIERSVESGYRMSQITQKQPLDETYEWNKVSVTRESCRKRIK